MEDIKYMVNYIMPSTPEKKPIQQISNDINQIFRMLLELKKDIQEIKDYINRPPEPISTGWFY